MVRVQSKVRARENVTQGMIEWLHDGNLTLGMIEWLHGGNLTLGMIEWLHGGNGAGMLKTSKEMEAWRDMIAKAARHGATYGR